MDDTKKDRLSVYEIGYQIIPSIPDEKIGDEVARIRRMVTDAGGSIIAEEAPRRQYLAYSIRKKTLSGSYDKYDEAHFGWIKFEVGSDQIGVITKAVEDQSSVLRSLVVTTVKENTYLGKRVAAITASIPQVGKVESSEIKAVKPVEDKKEVVPMSVEEVDKSIDEMVKEA